MSENKGKAKVKSKSKSKSTMKSAGKNKAAVMNSRNPKKPMAISGDTMSNYAMYRAGGTTRLTKHQDEKSQTGPKPMNEKTNQIMSEYDKKFRQQYQDEINRRLLKKAEENTPSDDPKKIYRTGYKVPVRKIGGATKSIYKAGGTTKSKFAALAPPYNKATAADRIAGAKKNSRKK